MRCAERLPIRIRPSGTARFLPNGAERSIQARLGSSPSKKPSVRSKNEPVHGHASRRVHRRHQDSEAVCELTTIEGSMYRCPCCTSHTLDERRGYEICPVCFWEDDGQDNEDADTVRAGPNKGLSLAQARRNYQEFGACHRDFVGDARSPTADEE